MNKQEILEKAKKHTLKSEKVYVSDWECEVIVRELSAKQYVDISNECVDKNGNEIDRKKFLNYAIIHSTYSLDGEQIFDNNDLDIVLNMSADGYSALIIPITSLNNLDGSKNSKNFKKATK